MPKIIHYRNKCIGCGICYEMQPELWRMSKKDGKAILLQAKIKRDIATVDVSADQDALSREVSLACPVRIIQVS